MALRCVTDGNLVLRGVDESSAETVAGIVRAAFCEQAEQLDITPEALPTFSSFESAEHVLDEMSQGVRFALESLDGEPVGTIRYYIDPGRMRLGHIRRLSVLPGFQGRDFGERLVRFAEDELKDMNASRIRLGVVAQFEGLQRYYARLGYRLISRRSFPGLPFEVQFMIKDL